MSREEALDTALGQIERQFGKGAVMKMNDHAHVSIGSVSTGSLALDLALGIGGLPRGRIVEIFGPESSGKTTLVYHVIAEAQRRGGIRAFIDAEHAMDPQYARRIGVNVRRALVSQPDNARAGARDLRAADRSGAPSSSRSTCCGADPRRPRSRAMGDSHVGPGAPDEPGAAQARRHPQPHRDDRDLHEPAAREDRGHVRQPETTPGAAL